MCYKANHPEIQRNDNLALTSGRSPPPHIWSIKYPAFPGPVYKKPVKPTPNNFVKTSKIFFPFYSILPPTPKPWRHRISTKSSFKKLNNAQANTKNYGDEKTPTRTVSKVDHVVAEDNGMPSDSRNKTALQGVTEDQSDGKFAKKPTATAATSKNKINTDTANITSPHVSINGNHHIDEWKWVELEEESPAEKVVEVTENKLKIASKDKSVKKKIGSLYSEGFKVIDGFLIPKKKKSTLKKKIQSRIPNITVRKPEASPSKTSIIKQSLSTIYHENSGGIQSTVAEYKPSTEAHCHTLSL